MHKLVLKNTLTNSKEVFTPLNAPHVALYVCGITPYDYAHLGHGRCYTTFDVLYRLLCWLGYNVTYCRNFTDIDDKLLCRAERELGSQLRFGEVAQRYIDAYHHDMARLNCLAPQHEPRVTEVIPEIIAFVQGLIDKGHAYQVGSDVYFAVDTDCGYGKLSKRELEEQEVGARVACNDEKRNPLDFALWKGKDEGGFWDSPWGNGVPGWHIECSVMSKKHLGETLDIHGGGMDLIFPHHENEIAQSECLHDKPFSRFWLHNAFVQINKEKMSKSLGNFFTLRDLFEQCDPQVLRYLLLSHHYRSPIEFALSDIEVAEKTYRRLCLAFADVDAASTYTSCEAGDQMIAFLCDDLNVTGALGVLFEHLAEIKKDQTQAASIKFILQNLLGLTLEPLLEKEILLTPEIEALIVARELARASRDWSTSDALRDQLAALGYQVKDKRL